MNKTFIVEAEVIRTFEVVYTVDAETAAEAERLAALGKYRASTGETASDKEIRVLHVEETDAVCVEDR